MYNDLWTHKKSVLKRLEKNVTYLPKNNGKRQRNGKHKAVKLMPSFSYGRMYLRKLIKKCYAVNTGSKYITVWPTRSI